MSSKFQYIYMYLCLAGDNYITLDLFTEMAEKKCQLC